MLKKRTKTSDLVCEELKEKIINGDLKPGQRIIETVLVKSYQISRTPLREALQCLENDDFLTRLPSGGLIVTPLSLEYIDNLFNVRAAIEAQIAKEAASKITADGLKLIKIKLNEMSLCSKMGNYSDVSKKGIEFHKILEEASENKVASQILAKLNEQINRYRRIGLKNDNSRNERAVDEHNTIYEAIISKDLERVFVTGYDHIINSKKTIINAIKLNDDEHSRLKTSGSNQTVSG